jgi:hypothetical protein
MIILCLAAQKMTDVTLPIFPVEAKKLRIQMIDFTPKECSAHAAGKSLLGLHGDTDGIDLQKNGK